MISISQIMRNFKLIALVILVGAVIAVALDGMFIVNEKQQAVKTQFGRPVGDAIQKPGLKFKIPFIQEVHMFDSRYLEWDGDPNQIPTKDKKFIFVDTFARWQITDPLQFFKRMGDERSAQSRLDDILDGETRDEIASHDLVEVVRSSNRQPDSEGAIVEIVEDTLSQITVGRDSLQQSIQVQGNERAEELGIKILDFRIKRINYVEDVRQQVYERMRSERNRIADKFISEGQGEASRINGQKEKELQQIRSEAFRKAEEIRGDADARAAAVYNDAYNRSSASRELYRFTKTLQALNKTVDQNTSVILSTDSEFYKYLNDISPQ